MNNIKENIPLGWRIVKIKDIAYTSSGGTPSTERSDYWLGGNIPWINSGELSQYDRINQPSKYITEKGLKNSAAKLVPQKSVLVALTGATTGQVGYLTFIASTNQSVVAIYPSEKYDSLFLFYFLRNNRKKIIENNIGSAQPHINKRIVDSLDVLLPDNISEQFKIAEVLSIIDEAIDKTDKLIEKYKRIKQGLMQDLFRYGIDENGLIRSEKTHKFKDSPLGRIPSRWEIGRLKNYCDKIQDGTHFSPESNKQGKYKYVTSKNIRFGKMDLSNCEYITEKEHQNIYKRCSVLYGDLLLTKDGANTGNTAINNLNEQFSLLSSVAMIRGNNKLNNNYLMHCFLSEVGQKMIKDAMKGLAITRITLQIIKEFQIKIPHIEEQSRIVLVLSSLDDYINQEELFRQKNIAIKNGLMSDLLSGKVRVIRLLGQNG